MHTYKDFSFFDDLKASQSHRENQIRIHQKAVHLRCTESRWRWRRQRPGRGTCALGGGEQNHITAACGYVVTLVGPPLMWLETPHQAIINIDPVPFSHRNPLSVHEEQVKSCYK